METAAPTRDPASQQDQPQPRPAPAPLRGGPTAFLRFAAANGMLNLKYARLVARWAWLKLRWRGRLRGDGLFFV